MTEMNVHLSIFLTVALTCRYYKMEKINNEFERKAPKNPAKKAGGGPKKPESKSGAPAKQP